METQRQSKSPEEAGREGVALSKQRGLFDGDLAEWRRYIARHGGKKRPSSAVAYYLAFARSFIQTAEGTK